MSKRAIVLYMHVHQPFRLRHYTAFDSGLNHNYFDAESGARTNNADVMRKVAEKSYFPMIHTLKVMLERYPQFCFSLSISGTAIEQFEKYAPEVLRGFQSLVVSGRVEIVAETYHHSLSFFYSKKEFEAQVKQHRDKVKQVFGFTPTAFRNTELSYNNELGMWADTAGYKAILCEGWEPVMGWRSPNFVYRPPNTSKIKLLTKNYKLSDDIAFRFGNKAWAEYPLTTEKFVSWANASWDQPLINLFMDFETFGEHQWEDTGIFKFIQHLPAEWLKDDSRTFLTVTKATESFEAAGELDIHNTLTWADTERDLSAWLGNRMQTGAIEFLYSLEDQVLKTADNSLIDDWRKLQTSDHFYYMCTKWWSDGDVHAYFSPYSSPYEAYINFINATHDIRHRLAEKGLV